MNMRVQTYPIDHPSFQPISGRAKDEPYTALEALEKGLDDLIDLCNVMEDTFEKGVVAHAAIGQDEMDVV